MCIQIRLTMLRLALCSLLGALLPGAVSAAAVATPGSLPTLAVVMSYHPEFPWTAQCRDGLTEALAERYALHTFYLDTKRLPASQFAARAQAVWAEVDALQPDLVLVGDDNALRLLAEPLQRLDKPVVYFGINANPRDYFSERPRNITGVLERTPMLSWLRHIQVLLPQARRGLILLDNSPTSAGIMQVSYNDQNQVRSGQLEVDYRPLGDWNSWQRAINEAAGRYDFIIMAAYFTLRDNAGQAVDTLDVVRWSSAHTPVPLFANQDYAVADDGVVGALVVSGQRHARLAAGLVEQIMERGKLPHQLFPETDREGDFFFNRAQLQRFGLHLPERWQQQVVFR